MAVPGCITPSRGYADVSRAALRLLVRKAFSRYDVPKSSEKRYGVWT